MKYECRRCGREYDHLPVVCECGCDHEWKYPRRRATKKVEEKSTSMGMTSYPLR